MLACIRHHPVNKQIKEQEQLMSVLCGLIFPKEVVEKRGTMLGEGDQSIWLLCALIG
jgi:hypothetical protein